MTIDKVWELEKIELMKKYPFENQFWLFGLLILVAGLLWCMFLFLEEARNKKFINESMKILIIALILSIPLTIKFFHDSSRFGTEKNAFFEKNKSKILKYVDVETYEIVPFLGESNTNYFIYDIPNEIVTIQHKTNQGNKMETIHIDKDKTYYKSLKSGQSPELKIKEEQFVNNKIKKDFEHTRSVKNFIRDTTTIKYDKIFVFYVPSSIEYDLNNQQIKTAEEGD